MDAGLAFLDRVIDLVAPDEIVAVGRIAERALGDRATGLVRHPSQGGAPAFEPALPGCSVSGPGRWAPLT